MFQLSSALFCLLATASAFAYDATWESLDSRPNPIWYDEAKVGIFIHWGVFSVPSYGSEWFWSYWRDKWGIGDDIAKFVSATESPNFAYPDYAHRFDATLYRPDDWAQIFAESGAQYVILTSKHHEGFCNWDSRNISLTWNWNAMDIGPRRDLLGDLAYALRKPSVRSNQTKLPLKFGVYHSLYEWYNPLYHSDKANNFTTQHFLDKTMEELYHLVKTYKPEIIWSDGEWDAHSDYWKSKEFLAWLANDSPVKDTAVWNDRWGSDSLCKHGGFLTCTDRYEPDSTYVKSFCIQCFSFHYRSNDVTFSMPQVAQEMGKRNDDRSK
jgi:alpha-L-fucosidase